MSDRQYLALTGAPAILVIVGIGAALAGSRITFTVFWAVAGLLELAKGSLLWWDLAGAAAAFEVRNQKRGRTASPPPRQTAVLTAILGFLAVGIAVAVAIGG